MSEEQVSFTYGDYWANRKLADKTAANAYAWDAGVGSWTMTPGGSRVGALATFRAQGSDSLTTYPVTANNYTYVPAEAQAVNTSVATVDGSGRVVCAENGLYTMNLSVYVGTASAPPAGSVEKMIYASLDWGGAQRPQGSSPYAAYYSVDYSWLFANEQLVLTGSSTLVAGPQTTFRPMVYAGTLNWAISGFDLLIVRAG